MCFYCQQNKWMSERKEHERAGEKQNHIYYLIARMRSIRTPHDGNDNHTDDELIEMKMKNPKHIELRQLKENTNRMKAE